MRLFFKAATQFFESFISLSIQKGRPKKAASFKGRPKSKLTPWKKVMSHDIFAKKKRKRPRKYSFIYTSPTPRWSHVTFRWRHKNTSDVTTTTKKLCYGHNKKWIKKKKEKKTEKINNWMKKTKQFFMIEWRRFWLCALIYISMIYVLTLYI